MGEVSYPVVKSDPSKHPNGLPDEQRLKDWTICIYHETQVEHFRSFVESQGGVFCGVVEIPSFNIWNDHNGTHYICVYMATEELSFGVWC